MISICLECNNYSFKREDIIGCPSFNHLLLHAYLYIGFSGCQVDMAPNKCFFIKDSLYLITCNKNTLTIMLYVTSITEKLHWPLTMPVNYYYVVGTWYSAL